MNIDKIMGDIIPPNDYQHRSGFSNEYLVDKLNTNERSVLEKKLIKLLRKKADMLIVETLAYMNSKKSLSVLYELLQNSDEMNKIIIASSIFEISKDHKMVKVAKTSFKNITDNKYQLISSFYYLAKFCDSEILQLIRKYTQDSDYLISHNAKQVLNRN